MTATIGGYSSHVLWVPDSDIGKAHQMLAWIDLANEVLGNTKLNIDVTFATFACVGAITHNVYDPADPNGVVTDRQDTNRPSHTAVLIGHGVDPERIRN